MKPQRIQLSRKKGWRLPENAARVARPSIFGNPYDVKTFGRGLALTLFKRTAVGIWSPDVPDDLIDLAYKRHTEWLRRVRHTTGAHPKELIQRRLRGRDLACWCSMDEPCHADILLEIANQ